MNQDSYEKNFISSKEAAALLRCRPEYVAQLCREGKFDCKQFGREWRIEAFSLSTYLERRELERASAKQELAEKRKAEYQANAPQLSVAIVPETPFSQSTDLPVGSFSNQKRVSSSTLSRVFAQGALLIFFGGAFIVSPYAQLASKGFKDAESAFLSVPQFASVASGFSNAGNVFSALAGLFGNRFFATTSSTKEITASGLANSTDAPAPIKVVKVIETVREIGKPTYITKIINNSTIAGTSSSGISGVPQGYVDTELQKLKNSLSSEVFKFTSTQYPSAPGISQSTANLAVSSRIDRLSNVSISNGTLSGGSFSGGSISNTSVSASDLAVSGGGTFSGGVTADTLTVTGNLSVSGTQSLSGALTIPYLSATSSTASSFAGGLTSFASTTIGGGTQAGGLTIFGGATTTGNAYFAGNIGIGTTTPWRTMSVNGNSDLGVNALAGSFTATSTSATSTFAGGLTVGTTGFRAYPSGVVGIGTNAPLATLDLLSTASTTLRIRTSNNVNTLANVSAAQGYPGVELIAPVIGGSGFLFQYTPAIKFGAFDSTFTTNTPRILAEITGRALAAYASDDASGMAIDFFATTTDPGSSPALSRFLSIDPTNTAAAPLLQLSSDTNTGFFYPATDEIGFSTAGVERVRLTSTGLFGIGTTTPAKTLSVHGNSYVSGTSFFGGAITATSTLAVGGATTLSSTLGVTGLSTLAGLFSTASSTIGSGTQTTGLTISGGATTTGNAYFAGNLGIGTTSPWRTLSVNGSSDLGVNALAGYFTATSTTASSFAGGFTAFASSTIGAGTQTTGLTINGGATTTGNAYFAGNVGIGTTSPSSTFSVQNNTYFAGYVGIGTARPNYALEISTSSSVTTQTGNIGAEVSITNTYVGNGGPGSGIRFVNPISGLTLPSGRILSNFGSNSYLRSHMILQAVTGDNVFTNSLIAGSANFGGANGGTVGVNMPASDATAFHENISWLEVDGDAATGAVGVQPILSLVRPTNSGVSWPQVVQFAVGSYQAQIANPNTRLDILLSNHISSTYTPDVTVMSLLANGNVGIGTTSPFSKFSLHAQNGETNAILFTIASSTASATTTLFSVLNTGNVGIGTTSPNSLVSILGTGTTVPRLALDTGGTQNAPMVSFNKNGATEFKILVDGVGVPDALFFDDADSSNGVYLAQNSTGWTGYSDARLKENVSTISVLNRLDAFRAVSFSWKANGITDIGVIAQELVNVFPEAVHRGSDGELNGTNIHQEGVWGVQYDKLGVFALEGVKELNAKLEDLVATTSSATTTESSFTSRFYLTLVSRLFSVGENSNGDIIPFSATTTAIALTESATASSTAPWLGAFADAGASVKGGIQSLGNAVVHVLGRAVYATVGIFDKVFTKEVFAGKVYAEELCLGSTCVTETELQALLASAGSSQNGGGGQGTSTPPSGQADTLAPTITLLGANPATTTVGSTYIDLGATIEDNVSQNLGYTVSVDGATSTDPSALYVDTAQTGSHSILFSATDQAGNVGTATRTVVVE